jgi:hypothetical protein
MREEAKRRGMSTEEIALQLIYKGIEVEQTSSSEQAYHDLDSLAGTWTDEEMAEFLTAIADFDQVDKKLWP